MSLTLTVTQQVNQFNITVSQSGVSVEVNPVVNAEAAAVTDEKVKVSANDTTAGYLNGKLVAGAGITLTENNDAGNETLTIDGQGVPTGGTTGQHLAKVDNTDYNTEWVDASSGGGEFQVYTDTFVIDNPNASNWVGVNNINSSVWFREYVDNINVAKTSSPTLIADLDLATNEFAGMAVGNQTVESLEIFAGISRPNEIDKIGMVKVRWTNSDTFVSNYVTELLDVSISISTEGYASVSPASFTNTSISDGDQIHVFFGTTGTNDIYPVYFRLKCSID